MRPVCPVHLLDLHCVPRRAKSELRAVGGVDLWGGSSHRRKWLAACVHACEAWCEYGVDTVKMALYQMG